MSRTSDLPPISLLRKDFERLSPLAESSATPVADFLLREISRASLADSLPPHIVTMGSHVEFRDEETGRNRAVTLVYPQEADATQGKFSVMTPIGAALIGLEQGQKIAWQDQAGDLRHLTVLTVAPA